MTSRIVRPQSKGMVTIPSSYRKKIGIGPDTLLEVKLVPNGVLFLKIDIQKTKSDEIYTDEEVREWMEADRLSPAVLKKVKNLLA